MIQSIRQLSVGLLVLLASLAWTTASAAGQEPASQPPPFEEGEDYERITPAAPPDEAAGVEVIEFFWYGCPHCYRFEPHLTDWLEGKPDDVTFRRVAATANPSWRVHAKAFYAAQATGITDELHTPLFEAIHEEERRLNDEESLAAFAAEHGASEEEFLDAMRSFTVDARLRDGTALAQRYRVSSVPTVIVQGTYRVTGRMAGTYDRMIDIMEFLVDKAHQGAE